jgi:hypothetical protein
MSFLKFSHTALPKSCQGKTRRVGRCNCRSSTGLVPPVSSSSSSSKSGKSFWNKWSKNSSKNSGKNSSKNSSNTSINTSANGDGIVNGEFHLLTILSEIDRLRLERDIEEASHTTPLKSSNDCKKQEKRKERCFYDADNEMDMETEDDMNVLREVERNVCVLERRKLVPVSQLQKKREWTGKNKADEEIVTRWNRLRKGLKERVGKMGECGRRNFGKAAGKF